MGYCTREDIENAFGKANVAAWADLDNNKDEETIGARIEWAISRASARVDMVIGGLYTTPMEEPYHDTVVHITEALAGCLLYDSRGIIDRNADGEVTHSLSWHRNDAFRLLRAIAGNAYSLGLQPLVNTAPVAIVDDKTIARRGYEYMQASDVAWPSTQWEDDWWRSYWRP